MNLIDLIKNLFKAKLSLKSIWLKLKELIKFKYLIKLLKSVKNFTWTI